MLRAYYNEFDPKAAAWLRELIKHGHITDGTVDERSIHEVQPADLVGFDRVHFFAGIAGWELALKLADWGDRPVWTGSCPCQPFSDAGQQKGTKDDRHLWPEFFRLIKVCRPGIVFGEQVASAKVVGSVAQTRKRAAKPSETVWLDGVFADLEGEDYTCGSAVLGAHSVNSPHIRQRLYWLADSSSSECGRRAQSEREHGRALHATDRCGISGMADAECSERRPINKPEFHDINGADTGRKETASGSGICCKPGGLANTDGGQSSDGNLQRSGQHGQQPKNDGLGFGMGNATSNGREQRRSEPGGSVGVTSSGGSGGLGDTISTRPQGLTGDGHGRSESGRIAAEPIRPASEAGDAGFWGNYDLIPCRDGKARRIESGTFPLAHGVPERVVRLRGFGNAIVPQTAAAFIRACKEVIDSSDLTIV